MVNTEAWRGGAARMAVVLAQTLQGLGEDVCLYHTSDHLQSLGFVGLRRFGSRSVNILLARLGGSVAAYDFGIAAEIIRRSQNSDVLHLHNLHGYYLNYRKLLANWRARPIVWTWHDYWGVTGRCGFSMTACDRWRHGCGECRHMKTYPSAWVDWSSREFRIKSEIYREMEKLLIVTPARWLRDLAIERGFSPERVLVIPNPVRIDKFKPQAQIDARRRLGLPKEGPLLLFVASDCNDPHKGYADFSRLVDKLQVPAVTVGKPPKHQSDLITHAGSIHNAETMATYYSAADLLVMTTRADNYPNVIIEAMACGTPVVSYNVGGIPDQMPEFWEGLVAPNDFDSLLARCQKALLNRGELAELKGLFRVHAITTWDPQIVAKSYLDAYQQAISI